MAVTISAYAPPTFSKPVLVYMTCQCDNTGEGAHILGCFVKALNCDHAMRAAQGLAESHKPNSKWFEIARFPSLYTALECHTRMMLDMQNGLGGDVGREKWEEGYEPYLRIYKLFKNAPAYNVENTY